MYMNLINLINFKKYHYVTVYSDDVSSSMKLHRSNRGLRSVEQDLDSQRIDTREIDRVTESSDYRVCIVVSQETDVFTVTN